MTLRGTQRASSPPEVLVGELAREVATIRGLSFRVLPRVRVETPEEITRRFRQDLEDDREALSLEGRLEVALGVLPAGTDLVDALSRLVGAEAQGYYNPDERVLVLTTSEAEALSAAGPVGVEARATVVHELTHALQHQHFTQSVESAGQRGPAFGDLAKARLAILEGDATVVTLEWTARRRGARLLGSAGLGERIERWAAGAQVLTEVDVPTYLIAAAELPYEAGAVGVGAMHAAGGWERVNRALERHDLRAAEVLHPSRVGAVFVDLEPERSPDVVLTATLGEMELRLMLARVTRDAQAARGAETWRGDSATLFRTEGRDALVWRIVCADEAGGWVLAQSLGPLVERWRREGCPSLRGGTATSCPVRLWTHAGRLTLVRGEPPEVLRGIAQSPFGAAGGV